MKQRLYLIILLCAVTFSSIAQTIGEAFYIYRNDGQFHAFFRDEVISIDYSYEDADGNTYDEIVTQIVNTTDSVYMIPLAAIDSVGFVQPETIVNSDVFPLTAEHSPYISNTNELNFTMSATTPETLRPKVGNIVVAKAECTAFPHGIIARVESVITTGTGYRYTCSQAYIDEVFDQLIAYQPALEGNEQDAPSYALDLNRASMTANLWNVNWNRSIEASGTSTTLNVGDRATATITIRKTLTMPFYFQLQLENTMTSSIGFNAQSTASISKELQIGKTITAGKITIPYTMGLLWLEPKLSLFGYFEEQGNVELNYHGYFYRTDKVTFTYSQHKWHFNHAPMTDVGTDVASLSMEGSAEIGLKPQIDLSLNGQQAGFGLSARTGIKEYINFVFDATHLADGGLYDAMRDSYCRTTIPWSVTVHANANLFSRYDASESDSGLSDTFAPQSEPRWGEDRYIFPLFANVNCQRQESNKSKVEASASVSRVPLLPLQVGFALLDKDNKILQTQYDSRSYQIGRLFTNYSCKLSDLQMGEEYIVRPCVKLFGYDVLASPSAKLDKTEMPVKITNFKQSDSHYEKDAFTNNGQKFSYKYDCAVTVVLTNSQGVEDWGYVYEDPYGQLTRISLRSYGSPYTDERYSYYRNEASSTVRLYEYVKYADDKECYYGEPKDYAVSHQDEIVCPDAYHPHWINLGLPSGTHWCCCNVGASVPEDYGIICSIGDVYFAPSSNQINELLYFCIYDWTSLNGVNGGKFTGPNGGTIFIPAAGNRQNGVILNQGLGGKYWSSTSFSQIYGPVQNCLSFGSGGAFLKACDPRYEALYVRPVH